MLDLILKVIINYFYCQIAILAFMAPFFAGYWYYSGRKQRDLNIHEHIERYIGSKFGNALVFTWATSEAIFWFVIPEFLLALVIFMRIHRKKQLLLYDIYGTAFGTLIAYIIHFSPDKVAKLPFITVKMVGKVNTWYDHSGIIALIHQPFSGVPYKVFTHLAPLHHLPFVPFLLFAVVVRISRYYLVYTIFMRLYPILHTYAYRNYIWLMGVATFIFSVFLLRVYVSLS